MQFIKIYYCKLLFNIIFNNYFQMYLFKYVFTQFYYKFHVYKNLLFYKFLVIQTCKNQL